MNHEDLQTVAPGFDDPVLGSQAVFRCALQALSMPGRVVNLPAVAPWPPGVQGSAALLLLALLDNDCTLWMSASLRDSAARAWLRFHTGCRFVDDATQARFLWLAKGDEWPTLAAMGAGTDEYPDQSSTCVMEVDALHGGAPYGWHLSGPGIRGSGRLLPEGLPDDFVSQWQANHAAFPRGVDVFLASSMQLVGLPRSTRLRRTDTVER
jgi:alpha-D-ribose 1-methylphosphonate 5-triphosphate synthase subunit PhnH